MEVLAEPKTVTVKLIRFYSGNDHTLLAELSRAPSGEWRGKILADGAARFARLIDEAGQTAREVSVTTPGGGGFFQLSSIELLAGNGAELRLDWTDL